MQISVPITSTNQLPDKYGKYAEGSDMLDGNPVRSFPITITGRPRTRKVLPLA